MLCLYPSSSLFLKKNSGKRRRGEGGASIALLHEKKIYENGTALLNDLKINYWKGVFDKLSSSFIIATACLQR